DIRNPVVDPRQPPETLQLRRSHPGKPTSCSGLATAPQRAEFVPRILVGMTPDSLYADVVGKYSRHINPYLARLMSFAGFGVEIHAEGCYVYDQDGRRFLDCLGGYGTFALGHRHPKVVEAVKRQLDQMGLSAKAFFNQ